MAFWTSVQTALIQLIRRPGYLIALALCPLLVLAGSLLLPGEAQENEILAGVCLQGDGETDKELLTRLQAGSGEQITFCLADEDEIRDKVAAGQWECGFVFPENLEERLAAGDWEELVTVIVSEGTTLSSPITEQVSAVLLELCWDEIGETYLAQQGVSVSIDRSLEEVLPEENWVALEVAVVGGSERTEEPHRGLDYGSLLPGLAALWLFAASLLAGGELCRWRKEPYVRYALPSTGLIPLLLPKCVALSLASLLSGWLSLALAQAEGKTLAGLLLYELTLGALSLLLGLLPVTERLLPVLLPVMPLISVVFSPLLVDVSRYVPALESLSSCLPLTGYLRLIRGEGSGTLLAQLAIFAAADVALILLFGRKTACSGSQKQ